MRNFVFCLDLDGTLFDNSHRVGLIPEDKSNTAQWEAFNCACADDVLIRHNAEMLHRLLGFYSMPDIVFFTGRGETARDPSWSCIKKKLYPHVPYLSIAKPHLVMRPMDDHRTAAVAKLSLFEDIRARCGDDKQYLVMDDDWSVICSIKEAYPETTFISVPSFCAAYTTGANQK